MNGGGGGSGGSESDSGDGGDGGTNGGGGGSGFSGQAGGNGGNGGFGGGGGGSGETDQNGSPSGDGGAGGFGGGGGGSGNNPLPNGLTGNGGNGGFGGGGGGVGTTPGSPGSPGNGGLLAGDATVGRGGGGAGLGGSVFVQEGGVLTILGNTTSTGNSVMAGLAGGTGAGDGQAAGGSMFLHNSDVTFDIDGISTINDSIAGIDLAGGGSARVTKSGTGTLNLNGANAYGGGTAINAGQLTLNGSVTSLVSVNSAGTLAGIGTATGGVTVNAGGTIAPGNSIGTLNVGGTYTQSNGSVYRVELNPTANPTVAGTDNDLIDVTGSATIDGGMIEVTASGNPSPGTTYTVLQTTAGVAGPGYAGVTDNLVLRDFLVLQTANTIQLQTTPFASDFSGLAQTFNQRQVGTALDTLNPVAVDDMRAVLDELFILPGDQQRTAFDQIGGELHGTLAIAGVQQTTRLYQLLGSQLAKQPGNRVNDVWSETAGSLAGAFESDLTVRGQSNHQPAWDGWIVGHGSGGNVQSDGNAADLIWCLGGAAFGFHRMFDDETQAGFLGASGYSIAKTRGPNQSAEVDHMQLGAYMRRADCRGDYYLLAGSWGYEDYETSREIAFGGIGRTATASYQGQQGSVYLERGWNTSWSCITVQPLAAVQYIHVDQNGFTEEGAGALNLTVDSMEMDSLRGLLGGRVFWDRRTRHDWLVRPRLQANWMHEFGDVAGAFAARFNAVGAPSFAPRGLNQGRDWALLGAGLEIAPREYFSLYANYDVQFNTRQSFHSGSGGVQIRW